LWSPSSFSQFSQNTTNGLGLELLQSQYLTEAPYIFQQDAYTDSRISYFSKGRFKSVRQMEFALDLNLMIPFTGSVVSSGFYFPEAYLGYNLTPDIKLTVGRKLMAWSEADRQHKLGIWEPLFRWDHSRPVSQGLLGASIELEEKRFQLSLFASPLYLPDQQAEIAVVDGRFESSNRWFRAPISTLEFQNSDIDLRYNLERPEFNDVVLQPTFAGSLIIKEKDSYGTWFRISAASKPANQLHIAINAQESINYNSLRFTAPVYPLVVRHNLLSLEFGLDEENVRSYFSFTSEAYESPNIPQKWEQTELSDSNYLVAGLDFMPMRLRGLPTWVSLGYLERNKLDPASGVTRIEGDVNASTSRMNFDRWFFAGISMPVRLGRFGVLRNKFTLYHSPSDEADWLQGEVEYIQSPRASYFLTMDIFGTGLEQSDNPSFISTYRNNDRVLGGLRYVF
jgi:hypothetical protein